MKKRRIIFISVIIFAVFMQGAYGSREASQSVLSFTGDPYTSATVTWKAATEKRQESRSVYGKDITGMRQI